jgi:hypothetical protein
MKTSLTWLLAGAALALSSAAYAGEPRDAEREAAQDARSAAEAQRHDARAWRDQVRRDRDMITYRHAGPAQTLTDLLKLRPDQQPALTALLEATRGDHEPMRDHMVSFERRAEGRTTLQKLDEMQAKMAEQQAEASRKIAAIKAFYGQLDAAQKQTFDTLPMLMVVGPSVGPMMLPHPMPIVEHMPAEPPAPPVPPRS